MRKSSKYLFILPILIVLIFLLSCATDYNKYADQYYQEGLVFYERMEYDRSIDSFKKVLEVAPYGIDNDLVYYNLGMAYFKQRQYDESIYQFTKALELIPEKSNKRKFNVLEWRGNAYQQNKDFDNAIKDYSGAIHLIPTHENIKNIYHNRAWSWINKRNYDKAIEDFSSAISIDPEFDASYYGRAYVWYKKADLQRAIIDAKEAVKLNPSNKKYDDLLYEIKSSKRVGDQALWGPFIEAGNKK
ncbi:MAG: tetratricopeptide repeat protein [Desulfobacterales bacterium]|jgi:tetratricopeptide (TPR) repeat protein